MHKNFRDAICGLALLIIAVGFIWVMKQFSLMAGKPSQGDLATWVGAFGAILAFAGAIFIAQRSEQLRRRTELDICRIAAVGMCDRMQQNVSLLEGVIKKFEISRNHTFWASDDFRNANFKSCLEKLALMRPILTEEILRVVALPNHSAAHISAAFDRIQTAVVLIKAAQNGVYDFKSSKDTFSDHMTGVLAGPLISLRIALQECQKLTEPLNIAISNK